MPESAIPNAREFTADSITTALQTAINEGQQDNRDLYRSTLYVWTDGEQCRTYAKYFCLQDRPYQQRVLNLFRLGHHNLGCLHRGGPRIERTNMECRVCSMQVIEDEYHFIFECSAYQRERQDHSDLFATNIANINNTSTLILGDTDQQMNALFGTCNQKTVPSFLSTCFRVRTSLTTNRA